MARMLPAAFKICGLLHLFLVTVELKLCSHYAAVSVEHTPSLQDKDVFSLRRRDGYDHPSVINFSQEMFVRLIRCLGTRAATGPCRISISYSSFQNQWFIYRATVGQINNNIDGNICEHGPCDTFECLLPDSFSTSSSSTSSNMSCSKQVNFQECFNISNICSSLILQQNGAFQTVYNVIWRSRGELTFSYNTSIVRVSSCSSDTSQTTDTSFSTEDSDNTATIAGVVCAILIIVAILGVVAVIYWRRKRASSAKGPRHCQGTSSSVAITASDQTDPSPENAETSFSRNAYSTVNKAYNSPYEQVDTNGAGYSTVHTDKIESKDKSQKHGQQGNITKPNVWPSSTVNQHLPASAEDGTVHNSEPGHEYSKLHENKRNFTNPYNELSKPTEDSQQPIPTLDASSGGLSKRLPVHILWQNLLESQIKLKETLLVIQES